MPVKEHRVHGSKRNPLAHGFSAQQCRGEEARQGQRADAKDKQQVEPKGVID
ncbi:hypothetical protein ABL840_19795 [Variovorax sp. NFACC27]|jgi:hypothetical protein|uniref:hypothetical protein n=1 Tax=Variovorax TaxID=34072 RepID=UPI0015A44D2D|nr:hypothetical protein [Variovorax gossypii]